MQTGKQWLTVPVVKNHLQRTDEVIDRLVDQLATQALGGARVELPAGAVLGELSPGLKAILVDGGHTRLAELDMDLMRWAFAALGIEVPIRLSSELGVEGTQTERLINVCKAAGGTVYLSGQGGRQYMELPLFEAAGIEVRFQEFAAPTYPQQFMQHGFVPNLAVVDALFNCGGEGRGR